MRTLRAHRRSVPSFSLYGETAGGDGRLDPLHIEDIPSRSSKYLWTIGTHRHPGLSQCVFVAEGPVTATLDEASSTLVGPVVIIVPSGTVHAFHFSPQVKGFVLTVDLDRLLGAATPTHQASITALFVRARTIDLRRDALLGARVAGLLDSLLREFRQPESLIAPVSGWLACCVLWVLAQGCIGAVPAETSSRQELARLRQFQHLVETHHGQHWPVDRYACRLALSQTSLNRLCLRLTGRTAFDLVQQRLSLESRRRLVYVAGTVAAIAAELGFKDPAYFCRFFRKHNGMSPAAFRRRHLGG